MQKVGPSRFALALLAAAAALGAPFLLVARAGNALLAPLTEASVTALLSVASRLPMAAESPAGPPPTITTS